MTPATNVYNRTLAQSAGCVLPARTTIYWDARLLARRGDGELVSWWLDESPAPRTNVEATTTSRPLYRRVALAGHRPALDLAGNEDRELECTLDENYSGSNPHFWTSNTENNLFLLFRVPTTYTDERVLWHHHKGQYNSALTLFLRGEDGRLRWARDVDDRNGQYPNDPVGTVVVSEKTEAADGGAHLLRLQTIQKADGLTARLYLGGRMVAERIGENGHATTDQGNGRLSLGNESEESPFQLGMGLTTTGGPITDGRLAALHDYARRSFAFRRIPGPVGIDAQAGNQDVTLSWDQSLTPSPVDVYRSETPGGPFDLIAAGVGNGGSYTDASQALENGVTYHYLVKAGWSGGAKSEGATISATPVTRLVHDTFDDPDGTLLSEHTPNIDSVGGGWTTNAERYQIEGGSAVESANAQSHAQTVIDTGETDQLITAVATDSTDYDKVKLYLRYVDANNWVRVVIGAHYGQIKAQQEAGGTRTKLFEDSVSWTDGQETLLASVKGDQLKVEVADGKFNATLVEVSNGTFAGMSYSKYTGRFQMDEFTVEPA
jgi:hypothetical protein